MDSLRNLARNIEDLLEKLLFASRWLLAPFYLGLAISLVVLLIKFLAELFHLVGHAFTSTETQVILGVLALVDLALTASLIVIVIFSGYENFVSKIDHTGHEDWPEWMGTIDFTALKLKLLSSIVAISAIQLLKSFMEVRTLSDREIMWLVVIHVVFVVSSVLLALSDRIAGHGSSHDAGKGGPDGHGKDEAKQHAEKTTGEAPGNGQSHAPAPAPAPAAASPRPATIAIPAAPNKRSLN